MKFLLIFLICFSVFAQNPEVQSEHISADKYFTPAQIIVPVSLITAGTIITISGLNEIVEDEMANHRCRKYNFDSFLQYAPHAALYGFSLFGVEAKHSYGERTLLLATSGIFVLSAVVAKHTIKYPRPDTGQKNSFPSGHTATAFWGAELVRREYPAWCGIIAYSAASTVGFMRIYNGRHWLGDVVAGAGFGILSTNAAYWLLPVNKRIFQKSKHENSVTLSPFFNGNEAGLFLTLSM